MPSLQAEAIIQNLQETESLRKQNESLTDKLNVFNKECKEWQQRLNVLDEREAKLNIHEKELNTKHALLEN